MDRLMFERTLAHDAAPPEGLSKAIQGLWWDRRDDWNAAHSAAQEGADTAAAWVHAYLHRKEGDLANSDYWYARANRVRPDSTFGEEWLEIVQALFAEKPPGGAL